MFVVVILFSSFSSKTSALRGRAGGGVVDELIADEGVVNRFGRAA